MEISARELKSRISAKEELTILDVRDALEFYTFNIGGMNIPVGKLTESAELDLEKEDELIVVCQRGIRSRTACRILHSMGYKNVKNLTGGLLALQRINNE